MPPRRPRGSRQQGQLLARRRRPPVDRTTPTGALREEAGRQFVRASRRLPCPAGLQLRREIGHPEGAREGSPARRDPSSFSSEKALAPHVDVEAYDRTVDDNSTRTEQAASRKTGRVT